MLFQRRPWREELDIVDRTMKAVSGITDPEEMVQTYWSSIYELLPTDNFVSVSRRGVKPPDYLVTRSSRFAQELNPWTQRDKLPRLQGGLLGEVIDAAAPTLIRDLPSRLSADDPAYEYLQGFQTGVALPQYDNGEALNMSVLLFEKGQEFDESMVPLMHWQSGLFGRGTQNLVLRKQLTEALATLDREMQVVGAIQRSLLPKELPSMPGLEIAASYETSARAGGDAYDFFPMGDMEWGIFIADVSGHGTPAAVLMAVTHAIAHTRPGPPQPPAAMMGYLNHHLSRTYTESGAFVTAFYATLNLATRRLVYSSAGHNPPRILRGADVHALDEGAGLPLGISPDERYSETSVELKRGDTLVLYTDGISEAMAPASAPGGRRELFGVERIDQAVRSVGCNGAASAVAAVQKAVSEFTQDTPATDDRTLIVMNCCS